MAEKNSKRGKTDDVKKLKKELKELKKEVKELEKLVKDLLAHPQKMFLAVMGYPINEEVFDGDGLGAGYVEIIKKTHKEKYLLRKLIDDPKVLEEVEQYLEDDAEENSGSKEEA